MDSPLLSSLVLSLGLLFSFSALLVQSREGNDNPVEPPHRSPPCPSVPPPPPQPPHHSPPPPPPHNKKSNQPSKNTKWHRNGGSHKRKKPSLGRKVGVWFIGVAAGLQVYVVGFLVYKRWKLFKEQDFYSVAI